ncbi:hypothetical protein PAXRUDRAFT_606692 [Paxillus rubicundulus Ve08.2h10]|uniref:Uncharacterized protein n=1 Tax=Paxillus rubicundulus Ve08.2h10 TaxID=930991 RepID=A0A0D0E429_9AGAM|nr:hypothetical protein PAXRUDRAFT_606692 [Paxillus rubicundulus Ve08.2h10]
MVLHHSFALLERQLQLFRKFLSEWHKHASKIWKFRKFRKFAVASHSTIPTMVYHKISTDMKQRALELLEMGWEMDEVTEALVDPPSVLRGRPRILNAAVLTDLRDLIHETPSLFLDEIGDWLAIYHDQPISTTALHDNLRDIGLRLKVLKRTAAQRDEVARTQWRIKMLSTYASHQLVFVDESNQDGRTLVRLYGRAPVAPQDGAVPSA